MAKLRLDFTGVESYQRPSEGEHVAKIVKAEVKQSQGGNDMIVVCYEVTQGQDKGARVYENYPLTDTALWKLKAMLQAIGMKCDGKVQLDLDKLVGKVCLITVIDDEYNGQVRSRVQECRKLAAASTDDEDDDIDEEDEEEDEKPAPKKSSKKETKVTPKKKAEPEEDEDDDDWDDEDEEDETPKKPAKKAEKKPAKKAPAKKPVEEDDDDDDDWDEE